MQRRGTGSKRIDFAAAAMAEYNGCPKASHIQDKLVEMTHLAETMHCCSLACWRK